jgi:NTP pyrophosphatase (non-canonical NTP hydrolase)
MDQSQVKGLNYLANEIFQNNKAVGWWDKERNKGELIALMHSELSECLEGVRKGSMDDHLPDRPMEEVELADTIIRILDYAGAYGLDVGGAMAAKLEYNKNRADHKRENREKEGGKTF